jgi:hypothetical protein
MKAGFASGRMIGRQEQAESVSSLKKIYIAMIIIY